MLASEVTKLEELVRSRMHLKQERRAAEILAQQLTKQPVPANKPGHAKLARLALDLVAAYRHAHLAPTAALEIVLCRLLSTANPREQDQAKDTKRGDKRRKAIQVCAIQATTERLRPTPLSKLVGCDEAAMRRWLKEAKFLAEVDQARWALESEREAAKDNPLLPVTRGALRRVRSRTNARPGTAVAA